MAPTSVTFLFLLLLLGASKVLCSDQRTDAALLLEWKRSFTLTGTIKDLLDSGGQAWVGELPCDNKWWGISCQPIDGEPRVTVVNFNLYRVRPSSITTSISSWLSNLQLASLIFRCPPNSCWITGSIPQEFGRLTRLRNIIFENTNMEGEVPAPPTLPTTMLRLQLTGNKFTGGIPDSIAQMTSLRALVLDRNRMNGVLPEASRMPPNVIVLSMFGNQFSGTLPASWPKALRIVKDLDLGQNMLQGSLPDLSGWSDTLELLSLPRNKFTGTIPSDWTSFKKLTYLFVSNNRLGGALPSSLPRTLAAFFANDNDFTGSLPQGWAPSQSLALVTLSANPIMGRIPEWWNAPDAFEQLIYMGLQSGTNLCGPVPPALMGKVYSKLTRVGSLGRCPSTCSTPPGASCTSTFFSLPEATDVDGTPGYLLAHWPGTYNESKATESLDRFCQSKGFAMSGTYKQARLPERFYDQDYAWITTNPTTGLICEGPPCLAYSVVECVSKGAQPLKLDSRNNIGCGNAGRDNIGNWNGGDGNRGSCNMGSNNVGDANIGDEDLGNANSRDQFFGDFNVPWSYRPEATLQKQGPAELEALQSALGWAEGDVRMSSMRADADAGIQDQCACQVSAASFSPSSFLEPGGSSPSPSPSPSSSSSSSPSSSFSTASSSAAQGSSEPYGQAGSWSFVFDAQGVSSVQQLCPCEEFPAGQGAPGELLPGEELLQEQPSQEDSSQDDSSQEHSSQGTTPQNDSSQGASPQGSPLQEDSPQAFGALGPSSEDPSEGEPSSLEGPSSAGEPSPAAGPSAGEASPSPVWPPSGQLLPEPSTHPSSWDPPPLKTPGSSSEPGWDPQEQPSPALDPDSPSYGEGGGWSFSD